MAVLIASTIYFNAYKCRFLGQANWVWGVESKLQTSFIVSWLKLPLLFYLYFVWTIWYMTNWLSDNNLLESWNHEKHLLSLLYKIKLSANTIELLENLNGGYIKHPEINSFLMFIKYNRLAGIGVYWRSKCMLELKIQQNTPLNCTQYTPIKIYLWVV